MKGPEAPARAALAALMQKDSAAVERMTGTLRILPPDAAYSDAAGIGYALHNIYCAIENSFDQIRLRPVMINWPSNPRRNRISSRSSKPTS